MKPVTERDVARLIGGEIDDPLEARRILDAIDSDPTLGELADFLSGDLEDEESEPEPLPFQLPTLTKTQLCRMHTPIRDLTSGSTGKSSVDYGLDGRLATFDLNWRIDGEAIRFEAPWPSGLRPIGLVLAQFKLARDTIPSVVPIKRASKPTPLPPRTGRGDVPVPRSAAAQTAPIGKADARSSTSTPSSYWVQVQGKTLDVRGRISEGRDEELVMAEVAYGGASATPLIIRVPVMLHREPSSSLGSAKVENFPWPPEREGEAAELKISALDEESLPLLSGSQVSWLLESDDEFTAIPILPDGSGQLTAFLDTAGQRKAFGDDACSWFVRMKQGGDA